MWGFNTVQPIPFMLCFCLVMLHFLQLRVCEERLFPVTLFKTNYAFFNNSAHCVLHDVTVLSRNVMLIIHALQERYHYTYNIVSIHCINRGILRGVWSLTHSQYVILVYVTDIVHVDGQNVVVPFLNTPGNSMKLQQLKNNRQELLRNSVRTTLNVRLTIVYMDTAPFLHIACWVILCIHSVVPRKLKNIYVKTVSSVRRFVYIFLVTFNVLKFVYDCVITHNSFTTYPGKVQYL